MLKFWIILAMFLVANFMLTAFYLRIFKNDISVIIHFNIDKEASGKVICDNINRLDMILKYTSIKNTTKHII